MFAEAYEKRDVLKTCSAQCATHGSGLMCFLYVADVLVVIHDVIVRVPGRQFFF